MIDEEKLRAKLRELWKQRSPVAPRSFAEAEALIDEVIAAATVEEEKPKPKRERKSGVF